MSHSRVRTLFAYGLLALVALNNDRTGQAAVGQDAAQTRLAPAPSGGGHILYVPLPADVQPSDLAYADAALRDRLHRLVTQHSAVRTRTPPEQEKLDLIVVFVDAFGAPVFPDLEAAREALRRGAAGVTAATDLTFTYNSPSHPWSSADLATLNGALNDFYPTAKVVYGDPAFNITVNISQDPTISFAGLYYPSLNEMVVHDLGALDPLCHEMIHAFRDDMLIWLQTYEEGMTRAAEVEVFNRLPSYPHWNRHHSYGYDVFYDGLNTRAIGSKGGYLFWGYVSVLLRYQLAGYAWAKPLLENTQFLSTFNRDYYAGTLIDPSTPYTEGTLVDIAAALQPAVEGNAFIPWYGQQAVLNTNPPTGSFVYQRINQYTIDVFDRLAGGQEIMRSGVTVNWQVYDYQDQLVDSDSGVTGALGWMDFPPDLPPGYTGRIKVVATAPTAGGTVSDTAYRTAIEGEGVFGVVTNSDVGSLLLRPLDVPMSPVTTSVFDGAFYAPELQAVSGRIMAEYTDATGGGFTRQFTKDASDYFLLLATPVRVVATDRVAAESGLDTGEFTISRIGHGSSPLTVSYTLGGTAVNGTDYQTIPSQVTIPANQMAATITITPIDDVLVEGNETVSITVAPGVGYSVGSPATDAVTLVDDETASYGICPLFDTSKTWKSGSTVPITLQLCDAFGANVSSPRIVVTALNVVLVSSGAGGILEDAGRANPDHTFRFSDAKYIFNLSLKGFRTGTYGLQVRAGNDPTTHTVQFHVVNSHREPF